MIMFSLVNQLSVAYKFSLVSRILKLSFAYRSCLLSSESEEHCLRLSDYSPLKNREAESEKAKIVPLANLAIAFPKEEIIVSYRSSSLLERLLSGTLTTFGKLPVV